MSQSQDATHNRLESLRDELVAAVRNQSPPEPRIRELVCAIVDEMKNKGNPPEKVVIYVKTAVTSGLGTTASRDPRERSGSEKLLRDCLGWCLKRYYEATE